MFKDYLVRFFAADYENKIIIFDYEFIESRYSYCDLLSQLGFRIFFYDDVLEFRHFFERKIKNSEGKFAVVVYDKIYVPYDILNYFYRVDIGWDLLFPNLNKEVLLNDRSIDIELLYGAYNKLYKKLSNMEDTNFYIVRDVYGRDNVERYIGNIKGELSSMIYQDSISYNTWLQIAAKKGKTEYFAAKSCIDVDLSFIDEEFKRFILNGYKGVSSVIHRDSPVMVSRVVDYIARNHGKVALIVLDGMSAFDYNIISSRFDGIDYQENFIYAMVPTTTAISRQSLLAGKFPVELSRPFDLSREERGFIEKATSLGYYEEQVLYTRGFEPDIGPRIKYVAIIINDIDDLVHSQMQGRIGMLHDIEYFANSGKLQKLIRRLYNLGFEIYLTSDHGNTICTGVGMPNRRGVEIQTKAKRMLVLKEFAENNDIATNFNMIEYPGYYLDKNYKYYICNTGNSFDVIGTSGMTHGGISVDEVIVPFIKIKEVNDG